MKKRLKIGLFVDTYYPMVDGVVVVVDNYATLLSKDHDVVVFAPQPKDKNFKIDKPYKIVRSLKMRVPLTDYDIAFPDLDRSFKKELESYHFDIIHIHSPFSIGKRGVRYAHRLNIPVIATFHSQYKKDFYSRTKSNSFTRMMMKEVMKVFNRCDMAYAVNSKLKELYITEYGAKTETHVRNNGTDLVLFNDMHAVNELRSHYNIQPNEKVLLFVGRIDEIKNIFFIVDVLEILKKKGYDYKMLFVGAGSHEKELKETVKAKVLEKHIIFPGRIMDRTELAKHYRLADLFMFPSLYDASSLVQIEAASQKTPTIFIEGAVTAATVEDGFTGYLAPNDIEGFTNYLIDNLYDDEKHKEISENTYKYLYKTWEDVVEETVEDYYRLIENHK